MKFGNPWLQLAISQCFTLLGRSVFEARRDEHRSTFASVVLDRSHRLGSPLVWLGIIFMILSFVTWLYVLQQLALSSRFPFHKWCM